MPKRVMPLIPAGLLVQQILPTPDHITIVTTPCRDTAACLDCGALSRRVHSRYRRLLGDLPWQERPVTLQVQARRFRCLDPACRCRTLSERLPGVAAVAARWTERLGGLQGCLGVALGGEAGEGLRRGWPWRPARTRCCGWCGHPARATTPRRPRALDVDGWSWHRGHRYGTMLVDLERNRVVDLLLDRQAGTLVAWLKRRPGVEAIARDRAGAYAGDARQGAPDAVQVAEPFQRRRRSRPPPLRRTRRSGRNRGGSLGNRAVAAA